MVDGCSYAPRIKHDVLENPSLFGTLSEDPGVLPSWPGAYGETLIVQGQEALRTEIPGMAGFTIRTTGT